MRYHAFLQDNQPVARTQVDITNAQLQESRDWMDRFMPFQPYDSYKILILKAKRDMGIGHIVGFEGEIPESKKGELRVGKFQPTKVGKSHVWTETDMTTMRDFEESTAGVPQSFRDFIFGTLTDLSPRVRDTHTLLAMDALRTGAVDYTDLVTGERLQVTYNSNADQYPTALAGTEVWTDQTGGKPIANIRDHSRRYRSSRRPDATLMNEETYDLMIDTLEFKQNVAAVRGVAADTAANLVPDMADVEEIFRRNRLPALQLVESTYEAPRVAGENVESFFSPTGWYTFGWENQGERVLGPVESNDGQSGIHSFSEELSIEPPKDRFVATSTGGPIIFDTRLMGGRKVA